MSMSCRRARQLLWPDKAPRIVDAELEEARLHVDGCAACRRFLAEKRTRQGHVPPLAPRLEAPPELRARLFHALGGQRAAQQPPATPAAFGRSSPALVAAGLLLVAMTLVLAIRSEDSSSGSYAPIAAIAEDHIRTVHDDVIHTSSTDSLSAWLAARIPFVATIPELPGASLEGARLCLLNGRRGVVLRYRIDGRPVSYYIVPAGPGNEPPVAETTFLHQAEAGYRVVAWQAAGLVHAFVGDLPRDRLTWLAQFCIEQGIALKGEEELSGAEAAAAV